MHPHNRVDAFVWGRSTPSVGESAAETCLLYISQRDRLEDMSAVSGRMGIVRGTGNQWAP